MNQIQQQQEKRRRSLSKVTIDFKNILELALDFAVNLRLHAFALNFLFIASPSLVKTKKNNFRF